MVYLLIISKGWDVDCPGNDQVHFPFHAYFSLHHDKLAKCCTSLSVNLWFHFLVIHEQDSKILQLSPLENQLIFNLE